MSDDRRPGAATVSCLFCGEPEHLEIFEVWDLTLRRPPWQRQTPRGRENGPEVDRIDADGGAMTDDHVHQPGSAEVGPWRV